MIKEILKARLAQGPKLLLLWMYMEHGDKKFVSSIREISEAIKLSPKSVDRHTTILTKRGHLEKYSRTTETGAISSNGYRVVIL